MSLSHFPTSVCTPVKLLRVNRALSHSSVEKIFVLIGPEGGFDQKEIDQAKDQKLQEIQTGPRILQSPTAALCAISLLQAQFGDS